MDYANRIAKGAFIIFIFSILGAALGYVLRLFIARNLSVEEFGLFYSVLAFFSFLWVIKDFGISSALVKYIPEFIVKNRYSDVKYSIKTSFVFQLFIGIVLGSIIFISSDFIAASFFHTEKASFLIKLFSIELVLAIAFLKMLLQGFQKIVAFSVIEIIRIAVIFSFIFVLGDFGLVNIALSYFAASMAVQIIMMLFVRKCLVGMKGGGRASADTGKKIFLFGSLVFAGSISTFLIGSADTMVLTYFRSLYEVGLYQAAVSTSQLLLVFASSLTVILFPVISEIWAKGGKDELSRHIEFMVKSVFFFMSFACLIFVAFPEIIISIFFGNKYIGSGAPFQILSFGMIFFSMNLIFSVILTAIGQPAKSTKAVIMISIFNVIMNIILVPVIGIEGAAISALSSYIIGFFIFHRYIRNSIKISIPMKHISLIISGSLISVAIIYAIKQVLSINMIAEAAICMIFALLFYVGFFLKVKIFTEDDIKIIRNSRIFPRRIMDLIGRFSA